MVVIYIIVGVVAVIFLFFILTYNILIKLRNAMRNSWAQIDVQLKRRHDLIPNLVETARGYMTHERETLEAVTSARNVAQKAVGTGVGAQSLAEGALNSMLARLLVVVENYPDLKANQNFLLLQEELAVTENEVSFARKSYNDHVLHCNNRIQSFPSNVVARLTGFKAGEYFAVDNVGEAGTPSINFH